MAARPSFSFNPVSDGSTLDRWMMATDSEMVEEEEEEEAVTFGISEDDRRSSLFIYLA